jgi:hypothetical protein
MRPLLPAATAALSLCLALPALAASHSACQSADWVTKDDAAFAADCVDMAFNGTLEDRQVLAWMFFARANQLVQDPFGLSLSGALQDSQRVPVWMTWATDPDTFQENPSFRYSQQPRRDLTPVAEKKDILAGRTSTVDPDGANEEVTRNQISYDYLVQSGLTTKAGVAAFFKDNDRVDMPVGSYEVKASWLQVSDTVAPPPGALVFKFDSGDYWWRGMHVQVKMKSVPAANDIFYSEEPSWFWATFEFNDNPGVGHVREALITQRAPLSQAQITDLLTQAGIAGFGFENYAPNGTQIRFTVDGAGTQPVILGHTDMEDFAGFPNTAQPDYWTSFNASCHACHATASYNTETGAFFPFSVPAGALSPGYNKADGKGVVHYISLGYRPLDFMWPIAFQTK